MILNYNIHSRVKIRITNPPNEISNFLEQELNEFSVTSLDKSDIDINFVKEIKIPLSSIKLLKNFYYDNQKKYLFLEQTKRFFKQNTFSNKNLLFWATLCRKI